MVELCSSFSINEYSGTEWCYVLDPGSCITDAIVHSFVLSEGCHLKCQRPRMHRYHALPEIIKSYGRGAIIFCTHGETGSGL
jgi:hypothetical protein